MIPQLGGSVGLTDVSSVLVPAGKGATMGIAKGMARALEHRAVKMGSKAATGAAMGAATSGAAYGVRKLLKKGRKNRRSQDLFQCESRLSRWALRSVCWMNLMQSLAQTGRLYKVWMVCSHSTTNNGGADYKYFIDSRSWMPIQRSSPTHHGHERGTGISGERKSGHGGIDSLGNLGERWTCVGSLTPPTKRH